MTRLADVLGDPERAAKRVSQKVDMLTLLEVSSRTVFLATKFVTTLLTGLISGISPQRRKER